MKKFLKILLSIIIIYNLLPSILGDEPSIFKKAQIYYLAKKYGGVYIFDKALYDEIVFLEKQIKELDECYKNQKDTECVEVVKRQLTTDGYFFYNDWKLNKSSFVKEFGNHDENTTLDLVALEFAKRNIYPYEKLSNGHTYYPHYFGGYRSTWEKGEYMPSEYKKAVIDYIGEKNYNKEKPSIMLDKFYVDKNDKIVPISIFADYFIIKTRYVLNGDEGGGFSFTEKREINISGENYFYINTSKDKNDLLK